MVQKKPHYRIASLFLMFAMLVSFLPAGNYAKAAEIKEISIGVVDDITTSTQVRGTQSSSLDTVYSFTLEKPGIVKASIAQTMYEDGVYLSAGVYMDPNGTTLVRNGEFEDSKNGYYTIGIRETGADTTMWLEAGTYYIILNSSKDDIGPVLEGGTVSVGVCCEYVDRTCSGNSNFQKAGKININDDVIGFLSGTSRKQYYKFTLTKPSSVEISSVAGKNKMGDNSYFGISKYKFSLCNGKYNEITGKETDVNGSAETIQAKLNKGTYYIVLDASEYRYYTGMNTLRVDAKALPKPVTPKVKKAAANASSIKGKTTANAVVYVRYSGKTYKVSATAGGSFTVKTPKLKKGKSVKVYAVKDYVKSNVRTVKVK